MRLQIKRISNSGRHVSLCDPLVLELRIMAKVDQEAQFEFAGLQIIQHLRTVFIVQSVNRF